MWLYYLIIIILKKYKKVLTNIIKNGIVLLVLETRAKRQQNFLKKVLTKKNSFDKIKKLKQAKNFEN